MAFIEYDAESEPGKSAVFVPYDADNLYLPFRREPKKFAFDERTMKALGLKNAILGGWTRNTRGRDAPKGEAGGDHVLRRAGAQWPRDLDAAK